MSIKFGYFRVIESHVSNVDTVENFQYETETFFRVEEFHVKLHTYTIFCQFCSVISFN